MSLFRKSDKMIFALFFLLFRFTLQNEDSILPGGGTGSSGGLPKPVNQTAVAEQKMESSLSLAVLMIGLIIVVTLCVKKYFLSPRQ